MNSTDIFLVAMMIIFANILLDRHLITADTLIELLLMAVVSTLLTVPLVAPRWRASGGDRQPLSLNDAMEPADEMNTLPNAAALIDGTST